MPTTRTDQATHPARSLADDIRIRQRFLRSVNLERDFYRDDPLDGYIPTESALNAFERIVSGVKQVSARAYTITGSYGTGKSAFALVASRALAPSGPEQNPCRLLLRERARVADRLFSSEQTGYWPVLVTGSREPVGRALLRGLLVALERNPHASAKVVRQILSKSHGAILTTEHPSARDVVTVFSAAATIARTQGDGCQGLLVVIDELGKLLEYAAAYPTRSDMQVLQELAEYAARSTEGPLLLVTILHQAFEDYAHRLSALQRNEWQKVQGRFIDIPFGDGPEVLLRLIAEAIEPSESTELRAVTDSLTAQHLYECRNLRLFPDRMSASDFERVLQRTYPLHPVALLIMPQLFRRFGQSERSLFTFLAGDDPSGFQEFLRTHSLRTGETTLFGVDHLYDYFVNTMGGAVYSHATSKLWSETAEALFRVRDRDPLQARLVKTIGLLSILGEQTGILPRRDVLLFALNNGGYTREDGAGAIGALEAATLITYRQFRQAYRLYEGSDIDVEGRLKEARAHFSQGADPIRTAGILGANPPIVARRHSHEIGTLRYFDVRYCRTGDLEREVLKGSNQGHGLLLLCLTADGTELASARGLLGALLPQHPQVIVGLNVETEALHEAAVAVETLRWVQAETPELRNDRVATREVRERLLDAEATFQTEWERLLRPRRGMEGGEWYYSGAQHELTSYRSLQELVSLACDAAYPDTPRILNELVNRRQLSSSAAAARRNLIEAMIERRREVRLGIKGFPPEFSMYVSVLQSTQIHRLGPCGEYGFHPPTATRDSGLAAVWRQIEEFLFSEEIADTTVVHLTDILCRRPYGMATGAIPVLLCAVLLSNESEVAVYEDGNFVTELDSATFERMVRRPGDFQVKGCSIGGERRAVLDRFARGLLPEGDTATLVSVVRELLRQFGRLPDYTWKTRTLSPEALALRNLLKHAKDPERLLFHDLPTALGVRPFAAGISDEQNTEQFFLHWNCTAREVLGVYAALLGRIETRIVQAFSTSDWQEVRTRSAALLPFVSEARLKAFVARASDLQHSRHQWLESVSASLVGKPPETWVDSDEQRFDAALTAIISAFRQVELVAFEKQKAGGQERIGMRVAVTLDSGAEAARVVLVPRDATAHVEELTERVLEVVGGVLSGEPKNVRMAVIGQVARLMIGDGDE